MSTLTKVPPHSRTAELAVVGDILVNGADGLGRCSDLSPDDFYIWSAKHVFEAALDLQSQSQPIDCITIANHLEQNGLFPEVHGVPGLAEMMESAVPVESVSGCAERVAELSRQRRAGR